MKTQRNLNAIHNRVRLAPQKLSHEGCLVWNATHKKWYPQAQEWGFGRFEVGDGVKHVKWTCGAAVVHAFKLWDSSEVWTAKRGDRWILLNEEEIRRARDAYLVEQAIA